MTPIQYKQPPLKKYAYQTLKKIYGINKNTINKIIGILALKPNTGGIKLTKQSIINKLNVFIPYLRIEFKLRLIIFSRIILLIYNKSYKGMRHIQGLPCRGQRTHANGKTPKNLKITGKNLPFKIKRKIKFEKIQHKNKKFIKQKKKVKISKKQKGKLKAKQKILKKKKKQ